MKSLTHAALAQAGTKPVMTNTCLAPTARQEAGQFGRWLMRSILITVLIALLAAPAMAQNRRDNRVRPAQDEVINLNNLPSGRLQLIDWKNTELVIDGKRYSFNDDVLRVYANDSEITLVDLNPNAIIRYQTGGRNGRDVVVRIWASDASSMVES